MRTIWYLILLGTLAGDGLIALVAGVKLLTARKRDKAFLLLGLHYIALAFALAFLFASIEEIARPRPLSFRIYFTITLALFSLGIWPSALHFLNMIGRDNGGDKDKSPLRPVEQLVLSALAQLGSESYGVPIHHTVEAMSGQFVAIGSIYATLGRLERNGYVASRLGEATPERGDGEKKYFKITEAGFAALNDKPTDSTPPQ